MDNKCYIQISFDVYHKESSQPPASSHIPPAAASSLNSTPFLSKSSAAATAPPQTPLGAYHHGSFLKPSVNQQVRKSAAASAAGSDQYPNSNYYQGQPPSISSDGSKSVVPAITLFGSKQLSSFKLVISSKPEVGIPYSVILPIENDSDAGGEVFTFLVDQQDVAGFMVQFDIFPAFGTKVIGRAVLSPDMIAQSLATSSSSSLSAADLHDQSGRQCCPLVDHHLRVVGQISFQCTVVQPFKHPCLSIGGKVDTYWKSTFTKFVSAPHSSTIGVQQTTSSLVTTALTTSSATTSTTTTTTTTQGLITTHSSSATGASSGVSAAVSATNVHSGIQSYITASSLMEEYIVVPVQVTGDGVAVIYGQWWVDIKLVHHEDNAVGVPLSSLTLAQLHSVTTSSMSSTAEAIQKCIQLPVIDVRKLSEVLKMSAMPLMDVLSVKG